MVINEFPDFLQESITNYINSEGELVHSDYYCDLQSSINICEVEQMISPETANDLRKEYLGYEY